MIITKGTCCDNDIETMTHCPDCGNLLVELTDIVDAKEVIFGTEKQQRHFILSKLEDHIGKCEQCTAQRFFYDALTDDP